MEIAGFLALIQDTQVQLVIVAGWAVIAPVTKWYADKKSGADSKKDETRRALFLSERERLIIGFEKLMDDIVDLSHSARMSIQKLKTKSWLIKSGLTMNEYEKFCANNNKLKIKLLAIEQMLKQIDDNKNDGLDLLDWSSRLLTAAEIKKHIEFYAETGIQNTSLTGRHLFVDVFIRSVISETNTIEVGYWNLLSNESRKDNDIENFIKIVNVGVPNAIFTNRPYDVSKIEMVIDDVETITTQLKQLIAYGEVEFRSNQISK